METLVIERKTLPKRILSYFDTNSIVRIAHDADNIVFTPASEFDEDDDINPDDYDDDTDYINAIPGMKERLLESLNAPVSEFKPAPRKYFNV